MRMTILWLLGSAIAANAPAETVGDATPPVETVTANAPVEADRDATALPEELRPLMAVAEDEERLVAAVRLFDREQQAQARWDIDMGMAHAAQDEMDLAETEAKRAEERHRLIEQAYEFVLARYPENARAHVYYGEFLYDCRGKRAEGVNEWLKAVELDPDLSTAHNDLGLHYCEFGEYNRGFRHLDVARKLEPDNPDYLYNATQVYLIHRPQAQAYYSWTPRQVYEEAMKLSKRAVELAPNTYEFAKDYAVNFFASEQFGVEPDWEQAAIAWQAARKCARFERDLFYTYLNEARAWLRAGQKRHARQCLKKAVELDPTSTSARNLLDGLAAGKADGTQE